MPQSKPLTVEELTYFKHLLLQLREQVVQERSSIEANCIQKNSMDISGNLSAHPLHLGDVATETFETQFHLDMVGRESGLLVEIDDALSKIQDGTYGICEKYQVPIPRQRLKAMPYARYCLKAQAEIEKRQ